MFSKETPIITKKGIRLAKDLIGNRPKLWNGEKWYTNSSFKSEGKQKVWEVKLVKGSKLFFTSDHLHIVQKSWWEVSRDIYHLVSTNELESKDFMICNGLVDKHYQTYSEWRRVLEVKEIKEEREVVSCSGIISLASGILTNDYTVQHQLEIPELINNVS